MKVSDCCGSPAYSNGDFDTGDFDICLQYGEHCEYVDDGEDDEEADTCSKCNGKGSYEGKIGGSEGIPEADVMFVCNECGGSGKVSK